MLILIAESKTMQDCDSPVSQEIFERHRPADEGMADIIMDGISHLSPQEIADRMRVSYPMAVKIHILAKEFPYKDVGQMAIEAFTGVVFKALDFGSLTSGGQTSITRIVRIISSLYGWLRPDDIIKVYRMDYTSSLAPDNETMWAFWRETVTEHLIHEIKESEDKAILNLLPADASKCVDWKQVKRYANIWKVDFKELVDGGSFATPRASRLKTLRGLLLREIIERKITQPTDLPSLSTPQLLPMETPDLSNQITFCV